MTGCQLEMEKKRPPGKKCDDKELKASINALRVSQSSSPVAVVHSISKPGRIDDGERQLDPSFLDQHLGLLHLEHRVSRAL